MNSVIETSMEMFGKSYGISPYMLLLGLALLYLIFVEKNKKIREYFLGTLVVFNIIYWCPFIAYIIQNYCIDIDVYWRMFWLLPITIYIAYVAVQVLFKNENEKSNRTIVTALVLFVLLFGENIYNPNNFSKAENLHKISPEVIAVADAIKADAESREIDNRGVILPNELIIEFKQYDGTVRMPYGRSMIYWRAPASAVYVFEAMNNSPLNLEVLTEVMEKKDYQYFVYYAGKYSEEIDDAGYMHLRTIGGYDIYFWESV